MDGHALASQPIGQAGLRRLATEQVGPRPAGTSAETFERVAADRRTLRATRP